MVLSNSEIDVLQDDLQDYADNSLVLSLKVACLCDQARVLNKTQSLLESLLRETEAIMIGEHGSDWADHFCPLWEIAVESHDTLIRYSKKEQ